MDDDLPKMLRQVGHELDVEAYRTASVRYDESCSEALVCFGAADEIERLRADLEAMEMKRNTASVNLMRCLAVNERMLSAAADWFTLPPQFRTKAKLLEMLSDSGE